MQDTQLKSKIISGIFWSSVQLLISRTISFVIKLILARLLFPEQFGLVGMALVFISFLLVLNDLGIGAALVQRKKERLTELHYHTAFWSGILWSCGVYLVIIFILSPLVAAFYNEPQLTSIIPALSLSVLFHPINLVHRAQLTRAMQFKKLAFINNASSIVAGIVAVIMAFAGAGVWALVLNSVAANLLAIPLYFKATGWLPQFKWGKQAFKDVFGFGIFTIGTELLTMLMLNLDYLLIGKLMSATALGIYTLAFILTDTFRSQITKMINRVLFPVYGQNQDSYDVLKKIYFKVVQYNSLCVYPMMIFLIVLGKPFIENFFGERWLETVLPLKILSVSVLIHLLVNSHAPLLRGLGKTNEELRMQLLKAVLYVPSITLGIYWYGIIGAAIAYVFNKVFEVIIAQYYLNKFLGIKYSDMLSAVTSPVLASFFAFIITEFLYRTGVHYSICTLALVLSYSLVIWLFMKEELLRNVRNLKLIRKKKPVSL